MKEEKNTSSEISLIEKEVQDLFKAEEDNSTYVKIIELSKVYASDLMKIYMNKQKTFENIPSRVAKVIKLLFEVAQIPSVDISNIKTTEEMKTKLREVTGLESINQWLRKRKNSAEILKQAGKETDFNRLWNFRVDKTKSKEYDNLKSFTQVVKDLHTWLKVVDFFIDTKSAKRKIAFAQPTFETQYWRIETIFLTFLISVTLETEKNLFSLRDLKLFLDKMDDYEKWKTDFKRKVYKGFDEGSGIRDIYEHTLMNKIIDEFSQIRNRNVFYFKSKLVLSKDDDQLLRSFQIVYELAAKKRAGSLGEHFTETPKSTIVSRISYLVQSRNIAYAYEKIKEEPYFFDWLNKAQQVRLLIYDLSTEDKLLHRYAKKHLTNCKPALDCLREKMSFGEMMKAVWFEEFPFNMKWEYIQKNRIGGKASEISQNETTEERFYEGMAFVLTRDLGFADFINWFKEVENEFGLRPASIPGYIALIIYFMTDEDRVPLSIIKRLKMYPWFNYITHGSYKKAFDRRVKYIIWRAENKNKRGEDKKPFKFFETDSINPEGEIVDQLDEVSESEVFDADFIDITENESDEAETKEASEDEFVDDAEIKD